ncbi:MAG: HDIG domain-containing protein [Bacteroidia bacterium]|nr:HDIG domain-containing protein [Bacteroidia bacterium]
MNLLNIIRDKHSLVYKIVLYVVSIFIVAYLLPSKYEYSLNSIKGLKIWPYKNLVAEREFFLQKSDADFKNEQSALVKSSPMYFKETETERDLKLNELNEQIKSSGNTILKKAKLLLDSVYLKGVVEKIEDKELHASVYIIKNGEAVSGSYDDFYTIDKAVTYFKNGTVNDLNRDEIIETCIKHLAITVYYDKSLSEKIVNENLEHISVYKTAFKPGDILIHHLDEINPAKREVVTEYLVNTGRSKHNDILNFVGKLIIAALLLGILMLYLAFFRKNIFGQARQVSFIFMMVLLSVFISGITAPYGILFFSSLPFALIPVLVRIFFDSRTALFTFLISILFCSFYAADKFQFVFIQLVIGMGTIFSVAEMRKRKELLVSGLVVLFFYVMSFIGYHLVMDSEKILSQKIFYLPIIISSLLILLAYPFIFLAEKLFGFISDFTLMELCDLNTPLLRELSLKVPGTFQHSLQVANLAEEAIFHIGGNALLVRTGAMYHDIGKIENPRYFTENQVGEINPHTEILPEESVKIIIAHVIKGIEKAKEHKLPDAVIDFIRTHHGTTTVGWFYNNFKKEHQGEKINEEAFRYPGPIPFSKETAVLMMADGVEAASRSLKKYDALAINELVDRIIDYKISENQLINAEITFKDITTVKKIFKKRLMNMYHVRIEYPR